MCVCVCVICMYNSKYICPFDVTAVIMFTEERQRKADRDGIISNPDQMKAISNDGPKY